MFQLSQEEALVRMLGTMKKKYAQQFKVVFDTIWKLTKPAEQLSNKKIGFLRDGK